MAVTAEKSGFRAKQMIHGADYNPDQWLECPEIIDEDFRLMKLAGMNSVSVGIFSWKKLEPEENVYDFEWLDKLMDRFAEADIKVILATPSGARPAWMDKKYPEILRVSAERVQNLHGIRHNHCKQSPYYRRKTAQINGLLAKRYANHPALYMWHIGNEYQGECHCERCQEAFRNWLREKYHNDINKLNHEWWTGVWSHGYSSFDEIESPSERGEHLIHGMNLDWRRFVTAQTVEFLENECKPLREFTPDIPVTTNFMGQFMDFNLWKLVPCIDIVSWDSYPEWSTSADKDIDEAQRAAFFHDRFRTMKNQPFYVMESTPSLINWRKVNKLKKPGMHELSAVQAIAHGADSVQYFQWRKCRGEAEKFHGAVVDHYGKEDTRVFRDVSRVGKLISDLNEIAGTNTSAQAAVIFDVENAWAIDDLQGWRNPRLYEETVWQHYRALRKTGINVDIIDEECSLEKYKLVAAPMLYMLRAEIAKRLRDFVKAGGTLILTYGSGEVNENDLCFLGGFPAEGLMEVAGVWAEEMDVLFDDEENAMVLTNKTEGFDTEYKIDSYCELINPKEGCEVIAEYKADFYAGRAAVTKNSYGEGCCYYLAGRTSQDYLNDMYHDMVVNQMPQSFTNVWGSLPCGTDVTCRESSDTKYYFVMNFNDKACKIDIPEKLDLSDIFSGEKQTGIITLEKYGYRILKEVCLNGKV